jgi:hypothetical protein
LPALQLAGALQHVHQRQREVHHQSIHWERSSLRAMLPFAAAGRIVP